MENKMLLLGICGSPRIASTDFVVKAALKWAEEKHNLKTEYFTVAGNEVKFCIHCDHCIKTKKGCVFKDDVAKIYSLMEKANAWIIGTPVYQGNLTAQTKAVLDRCRAISARNPKILKNKIGGVIAVGGDRIGGQEPAIKTIMDFFIINEMIPVGGGAFGSNLGGTIWSKDKMAEGAKEDLVGLRSIYKMVDRLAKMLETMKS